MQLHHIAFDLHSTQGASDGATTFILHDLVERIIRGEDLPDAAWLGQTCQSYGMSIQTLDSLYENLLDAFEVSGIDVELHEYIEDAEIADCEVRRGLARISLEVR